MSQQSQCLQWVKADILLMSAFDVSTVLFALADLSATTLSESARVLAAVAVSGARHRLMYVPLYSLA
jgi:hypothetical protein